ncbi:MAG: hypothetical protein NZ929_03795 [Aigarchaeota archaeon]|nr:hypothetical protein [Aigarchaeota archaeon]MCX8192794.1 hypothetical protein [Nitrososphaeria archaeon]MDW7986039.1 hypothetical protein [Nitrososphaerota archaeon]
MVRAGKTSIIEYLKEKASSLRTETAITIYSIFLIFFIIFLLSGLIYSLTTEEPIPIAFLPTGSIRVFLWSINAQSHAETIVIALYYLMGGGGVLLYVNAITKLRNPRTTKYMLFFSFLLILLAGIGIYSAYISKFTPP